MRNSRSNNEALIYGLLCEIFPNIRVKQQHSVKYKGYTLFFDFFIPALKVLIEVDGKQHDEFNSFFYSSSSAYYEQYYRDRLKEEWVYKNGLVLLRVKEEELKGMTSEELWGRLLNAKKQGQYNS